MNKTKHNLYKATYVEELNELLSKSGIDLKSIVQTYIIPSKPYSVLVSGSIAEGNANAESDLDLLVLIDSDVDFLPSSEDINIEYGSSLEVLFYHNGIEINIDFMARNRLNDLIESFVSVAPALYNPAELRSLPIVGWEDLQFLHRLKTGWVIYNSEMVAQWQDEFIVELLPIYSSVRDYFEGIEMLEDTVSSSSSSQHVCHFMGRKSVEYALYALLAKEGYTSQSRKWTLHWCERLKSRPIYQLLEEGIDLLFPNTPVTELENSTYVKNITCFYQKVRQELDSDPAIAKAITYLRGEINYIDLGDA